MSKRVDTSALDAEYIIGQADRSNREAKPNPVPQSAGAVATHVEERQPVPEAPVMESSAPQVEIPPKPIQVVVASHSAAESAKEPEAPREESKRRRGKALDYKSLFIREVGGGKTRVNKVVYIRKEHHDRILKVVQIIGKNEVSLFSFLDNVLEHHFSTYQSELNELYENSIDKNF